MNALRNALLFVALAWVALVNCDDSTTSSTTILPSSSTSDPSTTTLKPTTPKPTSAPTPEPPTVNFELTNPKDNITCILLRGGIRMTFNYNTESGPVKGAVRDVPAAGVNGTQVSGFCVGEEQKDQQQINLAFKDQWSLNLTLTMNTTTAKYFVSKVHFEYDLKKIFPDSKGEVITPVDNTVELFVTEKDKKYECVASQSLVAKNDTVPAGITGITTYSLKLEAFRNSTTNTFTNRSTRCENDEVSQLVPIIVGAALAGLIVIVLIAYLIGRKRSRAGYESV